MKKLKLIAIGIILLVSSSIQSQVSVNVNIGTPPLWGPVGYAEVDYYYLPDIEAYYDIRATQFIYFGNGRWIRSRNLPRQYRNYNLHNGYKVVLNDYHGHRPYSHFKNHKSKYYKGYKGNHQRTYGNRNGNYRQHDNYRHNDKHGKQNHYKNNKRYENRDHKNHKGNRKDRD
ncbi:hypothetical protein [Flavobacterium sp. K5-23]|uniref:hypothetical protein n=1 Tax=Flavobacterium sp. K5-23 TaxID=2746225 RepID=UPI00200FDE8B|nr:hypothetical protein [Flavobacterium sp. K5-23]UQD57205.1 hypothetical protein FLAK523_12705 [Flavobacterium sp. K5-23]